MTLEQKAQDMRNAIDAIELALMGLGNLVDLPRQFENARPDLRLSVPCTVRDVIQVCKALEECTRIINSPEYEVRNRPR